MRPADLAQIEVQLRDGGGEERQPPPRKFVLPGQSNAPQNSLATPPFQTLAVWTGQEPGERIANTILLCAIRDRARQVILEPGAQGVRVRFQIESGVREQKLPGFALAPIVRHFKTLASDAHSNLQGNVELDDFQVSGAVSIAVDEQFFYVQFSPFSTQWGEGVKVDFSPRASC